MVKIFLFRSRHPSVFTNFFLVLFKGQFPAFEKWPNFESCQRTRSRPCPRLGHATSRPIFAWISWTSGWTRLLFHLSDSRTCLWDHTSAYQEVWPRRGHYIFWHFGCAASPWNGSAYETWSRKSATNFNSPPDGLDLDIQSLFHLATEYSDLYKNSLNIIALFITLLLIPCKQTLVDYVLHNQLWICFRSVIFNEIWRHLAQISNYENTLKTECEENNGPIFALKVSKEAHWMGLQFLF